MWEDIKFPRVPVPIAKPAFVHQTSCPIYHECSTPLWGALHSVYFNDNDNSLFTLKMKLSYYQTFERFLRGMSWQLFHLPVHRCHKSFSDVLFGCCFRSHNEIKWSCRSKPVKFSYLVSHWHETIFKRLCLVYFFLLLRWCHLAPNTFGKNLGSGV